MQNKMLAQIVKLKTISYFGLKSKGSQPQTDKLKKYKENYV